MDDKLRLVLVDDQEDILETLEIKIPTVCEFEIEMFTFTNLQDLLYTKSDPRRKFGPSVTN